VLNILIVAIAVSTAIFCGGLLLMRAYNRHGAELDARLDDLRGGLATGRTGPAFGETSARGSGPRGAASAATSTNGWLTGSEEERKQNHARLVQAGIYNPAALFLFYVIKTSLILAPLLVCLASSWLGLTRLHVGMLWGASASAVGMLLPSFWLESRIRRRHSMFRHSIADFLDLMIVCLEGGLSLQGTVQRVSDEMQIAHPELAFELSIVQRDIALGATIDAALRRFADRTGFEGIRSLATCVRESQRFGTQLSNALRVHADMLRSQRENAAEEQAQKAAVKILIPMLLLIMPAVFVVLAGPAAIQIQQAFAK
jgi:tight adherence protein C